jgi:signal transduction histidine kinase
LEIHNSFTLEKKETDHLSHLEEHPDFLESSEGIILLIRDVTDIHRMQNLAALNNRMKELGEMAAMVAHEIRNPLGGINGLASLLERDLAGQPELQKMATYIIEGTQGLNQLVNSILNYTRPLVPQIESLDLVELLNDLTRLILAEKNNHESIEVVINSQQIPFIIPGDMQLLKSAFLNLAINAVQAMPSGGKLTFSIEKIKNQAIIKIADTGCGIPSENISKLFSPFFTTKAQGNGFGLAEVNKVILAHGGSIAASSLVNKGTTFTVKLPMNIYSNA